VRGNYRLTTDTGKPLTSNFRAWLEILRVPNLFTVPGDPIVGFLLASVGQPDVDLARVIWPALAALFLYCAGLVSNDVFDLGEDRRDRPERPIPSGRISKRAPVIAALSLFVLGIASAFLAETRTGWLACALTLLILLYNGGLKRITLVGPLTMGLCRGFSLLLGASVFATGLTTPVVLVAAGGLTLYILSVTLIAARETSGRGPGNLAFLPVIELICLFPACWFASMPWESERVGGLYFSLGCLTVIFTFFIARNLRTQTHPKQVSNGIGRLLLMLIPLQGSLAAMTEQLQPVIVLSVLVALFICAERLGRRFYAS